MRAAVVAAVLGPLVFVAGRAAAGPDPYSPASQPPPASFYANYTQNAPTSSFVARSPALRALGIGMIVAGGLTLVVAPIVGSTSQSPAGDPTAVSSSDGVVFGLIFGGFGLIGAGIPVAVYGATGVPPPKPGAVRVEPTINGLRVIF